MNGYIYNKNTKIIATKIENVIEYDTVKIWNKDESAEIGEEGKIGISQNQYEIGEIYPE